MNHGEDVNRALKAHRFADWIAEHADGEQSPDQLAFGAGNLSSHDWEWIAEQMGEHVPSYRTRALIVNELRMRADTAPIEWEKLNR